MIIYNRELNISISELYLFLIQKEALDLANELKGHLEPSDYNIIIKGMGLENKLTKEIIIRIYDENHIQNLDEKIKNLILNDK